MPASPANEARFTFRLPDLDEDELVLTDFVGKEAISQPFQFELNLLSRNATVPFSAVVDQPATLTMHAGREALPIHGVVADFQQGRPVGEFFSYRAVLVPRLWRLSLTHRSRVFQDLSAPEIVRQVLEEAGFAPNDFRFALAESYAARDYCTQYKETDLAFVSRLLEYEGIQFFFEQSEGCETLVMTDRRSENPLVAGEEEIAYRPAQGFAAAHEETVYEFVFREQLVPGRVVLKDYNYRTPDADLRAESELTDELPGTYYDYGLHFKDADTGERLARVRNEELYCQRRRGLGEGTAARLRAGHRFHLDEHYRLDLNQEYLVTEVRHIGSQRGLTSMQAGADEGLPYRNEFVCIPAAVPFRPPRVTPEPKLPGIMTAKVESGGGDYADLDEQGRYRVKMPFDLADTEAAQASKPIRLAQPYAGTDYGMHFPVHADAEMVFACVDGNVDRPLGLSTVPNPNQRSPVTGENRSRNVIRTASQNEIYLEDEKGNERIKLYSPKGESIIQLGSPNLQTLGVGISTDETAQLYGKGGVVVKAGEEYVPDNNIAAFKNGLTMLDGAIGVAKAFVGGSFRDAGFGGAMAITSTYAGIAWPGVYVAGKGGVAMYSGNGITGLAGPGGVGWHSVGGGVDLAASTGISLLTAAGGIKLASAVDGITAVCGSGGITATAKQGDVDVSADAGALSLEADQEVKLRSMNANVRLLTLKDNKILLQSRNEIRQEAKRDIHAVSEDGRIVLDAPDGIHADGKGGGVRVSGKKVQLTGSETSDGGVELRSGGSAITLSPQKIVLSAGPAKITLTAAGNVIIEGVGIVNKSSLKFEVESNAQVKLSAKAIAQLKGAISQIG